MSLSCLNTSFVDETNHSLFRKRFQKASCCFCFDFLVEPVYFSMEWLESDIICAIARLLILSQHHTIYVPQCSYFFTGELSTFTCFSFAVLSQRNPMHAKWLEQCVSKATNISSQAVCKCLLIGSISTTGKWLVIEL